MSIILPKSLVGLRCLSKLKAWAILKLFLWICLSTSAISIPIVGQVPTPGHPTLITKIGEAHDLPSRLVPYVHLHLTGTVTYYDPADVIMFIQDTTGGIFVDTTKSYPVHMGDLVEVDGAANASFRTEVANDPAIRVLGRGSTFNAPLVDYSELVVGIGDSKLVTIQGRVRAQTIEQHENAQAVHLDILMAGGEVQVYVLSSSATPLQSMLDETVEITAVAGGAFDAKWQQTGVVLYAPQPSAIRILRVSDKDLKQLPLTTIGDILQSQNVEDRSHRVRVRGVVIYYKKGDFAVLENNGDAVYVQTRQTDDLAVGDVVDAFGFSSDREYSPGLRTASIVKTGDRLPVAPRPVTYAEALSGVYSNNLVSLSGVLISELLDADTHTIVIDVDGHLVSGYLYQKTPPLHLLLGSHVRITGVCRIVSGGPWRKPSFFRIEMRSPADIQLIAQPSWWTIRHLIELLIALLIVATAIATWAVLLRMRIVQQTARIGYSMNVAKERSRILEMISSNRAPEVLLSEICESAMKLQPGIVCSYSFNINRDLPVKKNERRNPLKGRILFEVALRGVSEEPIGRIVISAQDNRATFENQQELYIAVSELATLAIRQSLLHQRLVHHSTHDALTELPNRRLCDSRLGAALEEAVLSGGRLAVVYIDVNRFKQVNDTHGHTIGDLYLREISTRLIAKKRSGDTLARVGGDEFLLIASLTSNSDEAKGLVARLQTCFDEPFFLEGERIDGSASFGFATYPEDGKTAEELQFCADQSMYASKRLTANMPNQPVEMAAIID